MVSLIPMTEDDFAHYTSNAITNYAEDKMDAGTWGKDEAMAKSAAEFEQLLPNGLDTPHQYLHTIYNDLTHEKLGYIWYHFDDGSTQKEAFIYDFLIFEEKRGQGNGEKTLKALDELAANRGICKLSLHVFAHNKTAIRLYEKTMFQATDIMMSKYIKQPL